MRLLRILNVVFYVGVLYFIYAHFIDQDFWSHLGGAELAFLVMMAVGVFWTGLISYGLTAGTSWGFSHAVWLNGIVIFVLIVRFSMTALGGDFLTRGVVVKNALSLVVIVLLLYSCIAYIRRKERNQY